MNKLKIAGKELRAIGFPEGPVISIAMRIMEKNYKHHGKEEAMGILKNILAAPVEYENDAVLGQIAQQLIPKADTAGAEILLNHGISTAFPLHNITTIFLFTPNKALISLSCPKGKPIVLRSPPSQS